MMELKCKSVINNFNLQESNCMLILYIISVEDGIETGSFPFDTKIISGEDYDKYVNQANQTIDEKFIKDWENTTLQPLMGVIKNLEKDSNK